MDAAGLAWPAASQEVKRTLDRRDSRKVRTRANCGDEFLVEPWSSSSKVYSRISATLKTVGEGGSPGDVTQLLAEWGRGERAALDAATSMVYAELHKIATSYLQSERSDHTLQPTALIHEAYVRLVKEDKADFENRKRFFAFAARLMRQILVDHARTRSAEKRGGGIAKIPLNEAVDLVQDHPPEFLALNEALDRLAGLNPRKAEIIELRYFGGLSVEETAEVLDTSAATVSREQRLAEAWLSQAMDGSSG